MPKYIVTNSNGSNFGDLIQIHFLKMVPALRIIAFAS